MPEDMEFLDIRRGTDAEIITLLPKTESEIEAMIDTGYAIAKNMSWDIVVSKYILPSIEKVLNKPQSQAVSISA